MAIKVVSEAPVKTKQVVCSKCCYKLEYTGEDVKEMSHRDITGHVDITYHIVCPRNTCNQRTNVSAWEAP